MMGKFFESLLTSVIGFGVIYPLPALLGVVWVNFGG